MGTHVYRKSKAGESEDNTESESENFLGLGHFAQHSEFIHFVKNFGLF